MRTPSFLNRTAPAFVVAGCVAVFSFVPMVSGRDRHAVEAAQESAIPAELVAPLAEWSAEFFPGDPGTYAENLADPITRKLVHGRVVYDRYCVGCHGDAGDGHGASAPMLIPRPRNFLYGLTEDDRPVFKFRSTGSGQPPLREDVERVVRNGLPGSAMPNHLLLDPKDVTAVADYVLWTAQRSEFEQAVRLAYLDEEPDLSDPDDLEYFYEEYVELEAESVAERYGQPRLLVVGAEPANDEASVERGREVYFVQGCHECHGDTGRGDGSSAASLKDDWGFPTDPRDFSTGKFRAGSSGRDIYLRIAGGVAGTPMPAFEDMSNEDLWHLVHFIQSMKRGGER